MIVSTPANTTGAFSPVSTASRAFPAHQKTSVRLSPPVTSASSPSANTEEMARLGVNAIFRLRSLTVTQQVLRQVERRDRVVLLLQDGQRTLRDVASLLHRSEIEIAQVMVRLLQQGYIEFIGMRH